MKNTRNNIINRIIAVVLLVATLAGITASVNKKVEAACNHSRYTQTIITSPSCKTTGLAYRKCSDCGYTWHATLPKTAHSYCVKEVSGKAQLRCIICNERFFFSSTQAGVDDFAKYIYGKQYNALSGSWTSGERQNAVISWISYAIGCTKEQAKTLCKDYYMGFWLEVKNASNLAYFINKCSDISSRYGLEEADALAGIASQATFRTCIVLHSRTSGSKELTVLAKTSPSYSRLTKDYKAKCREFLNLRLVGNFNSMKNKFANCNQYGISFAVPSSSSGTPSITPTYSQLFNTTNGKTNLDRFCGYLVGNENIGFRNICINKSTYAAEYSYIMIWLVRPALKKMYANCFSNISSDPMVLFSEALNY